MPNNKIELKSADDTQVEMTQVVLPQFANAIGTVFGGQVVSWIDICAAVAAQRHCRLPVVTVSIDSVHFQKPIKQGQVVVLKSRVNAVFRTSLEIGVVVFAEDPVTGQKCKAVSAYCTFVALGMDGRPSEIPGLMVVSAEDKRREQAAIARRKQRLSLRHRDELQEKK
jgi:acyl-CoA hydrolase